MMEAYKSYWRNGFNFEDRTSRRDYWYVWLMNIIIFFAYFFLLVIFMPYEYAEEGSILAPALIIFLIANIIPNISITVRRLHDINESGAWYFIQLIPYVGSIVLLIFLCMQSVNQKNKYGKQV